MENPARLLYGRLPGFVLSRRGRDEARQAARYLARRGIRALYSSPLLRACQSALILATECRELAVRHDARLIETWLCPDYLGKPQNMLLDAPYFANHGRDPGIETPESLRDRLFVFARHAALGPLPAAAVTHRDPLIAAYLFWAGLSPEEFLNVKFPTGGVIEALLDDAGAITGAEIVFTPSPA